MKMKNRLYYILFLSFLSFYTYAQKSKEVTFTKKTVKLPSAFIHDAFSINSSEFIMISYQAGGFIKRISATNYPNITLKNNSKLQVYKFDEDLNLIQKKSIKREFYGKRVWIEKLLKFGDNAWLFFSYSNVETKKNYLFAQKFDYINLELEDEPIKIAEMPYIKKRYNYGYYDFNLSENGKYLMISGVPAYTSRSRFSLFKTSTGESDGTLTVWVLNQKMEMVNYVKKVKLSGNSKKTYIKSSLISDDGSFVFMGAEKKEKEKKRSLLKKLLDNTVVYEFSLIHYDSTGESHNYSLKGKNLKIVDIKTSVNNNTGNYCIMGLYTDNNKGAKGIISVQLSPDDFSEISYVKQAFSDDFIKNANKKFDSKSTKPSRKSKKKKDDEESNEDSDDKPKSKYLGKLDKNKKESNDNDEEDKNESKETKKESKENKSTSKDEISSLTKVIDILYDEKDNPIGIFEKQWTVVVTTTTRNSNGSTSTHTTYYYYYGDVIVAKIENEEISQSQIIRKIGYLTNIYYPEGISSISNDSKIILSYKDKHIEYDKEDLSTKNKNATTKRELNYRMTGFQIKLSKNKSIVTNPRSFKRLELEYIKAK